MKVREKQGGEELVGENQAISQMPCLPQTEEWATPLPQTAQSSCGLQWKHHLQNWRKEVSTDAERDLLLIEFYSFPQHMQSAHLMLAWPGHLQPRAHLSGSPLRAVPRMQKDKNYLITSGENLSALQQNGQSQSLPVVFTMSFFMWASRINHQCMNLASRPFPQLTGIDGTNCRHHEK